MNGDLFLLMQCQLNRMFPQFEDSHSLAPSLVPNPHFEPQPHVGPHVNLFYDTFLRLNKVDRHLIDLVIQHCQQSIELLLVFDCKVHSCVLVIQRDTLPREKEVSTFVQLLVDCVLFLFDLEGLPVVVGVVRVLKAVHGVLMLLL